jgi:hypothetical protein
MALNRNFRYKILEKNGTRNIRCRAGKNLLLNRRQPRKRRAVLAAAAASY